MNNNKQKSPMGLIGQAAICGLLFYCANLAEGGAQLVCLALACLWLIGIVLAWHSATSSEKNREKNLTKFAEMRECLRKLDELTMDEKIQLRVSVYKLSKENKRSYEEFAKSLTTDAHLALVKLVEEVPSIIEYI